MRCKNIHRGCRRRRPEGHGKGRRAVPDAAVGARLRQALALSFAMPNADAGLGLGSGRSTG